MESTDNKPRELPPLESVLSPLQVQALLGFGYGSLEDFHSQVLAVHAPEFIVGMEGIGGKTLAMMIAVYKYFGWMVPGSHSVWYNKWIKTKEGALWLLEHKDKSSRGDYTYMTGKTEKLEGSKKYLEESRSQKEVESAAFIRAYVSQHAFNAESVCHAFGIKIDSPIHARQIVNKHWSRLDRIGKIDEILKEVGVDSQGLVAETALMLQQKLHDEDGKIVVSSARELLKHFGSIELDRRKKSEETIPGNPEEALDNLAAAVVRVLRATNSTPDEFFVRLSSQFNLKVA